MSKMLAIIDKPITCFECPMVDQYLSKCTLCDAEFAKGTVANSKPDWCPLIPLDEEEPERKW